MLGIYEEVSGKTAHFARAEQGLEKLCTELLSLFLVPVSSLSEAKSTDCLWDFLIPLASIVFSCLSLSLLSEMRPLSLPLHSIIFPSLISRALSLPLFSNL